MKRLSMIIINTIEREITEKEKTKEIIERNNNWMKQTSKRLRISSEIVHNTWTNSSETLIKYFVRSFQWTVA